MNGGQVVQPQQRQQQEQSPTTQDIAQGGARIEMTTVAGAAPQAQTAKMQQQEAPAPTITPAIATAATNGGSAGASTSAAGAGASTGTGTATATGTGTGTGTGTSNDTSATVAEATTAIINKKRKKEGLKPLITTESSEHTGSYISLAWIADITGARRLAGGEQVLRPYVATKTSVARTQSVMSNPSSMPDTSCIRHWSTGYCFFSSPFPSQLCSAAVQCCAARIFIPRQEVAGKPGSQLVGGGVRSGLRRRSG
ncbi:hypothetical protein VPNG_08211 [Cytospora leucostoma]|uniref:Uncharacterized protein n=1 Tax=Cytospora leucostoma TaxID=1230097 RepID=A0A423W763_9PEZI|nr:hypothetical protein VPNG_08211 [Cytospora leucostoma]